MRGEKSRHPISGTRSLAGVQPDSGMEMPFLLRRLGLKGRGLHEATANCILVHSVLNQATVLCDVIVLYCMKKRYYYRDKKYKYVEDYEQVCSWAGQATGLSTVSCLLSQRRTPDKALPSQRLALTCPTDL